jgi:GR25 family glycosyltransferase involved in LPS biosynthesis
MKHILVISAYHNRREKYTDDYHIYDAKWWENVIEEDLKPYTFRHNIKEPLKKKICACSISHKGALKKIVDEKIENCIIIEDDAILDLSRLNELDNIDHFCYIGGNIRSPLLKDDKLFNNFYKNDYLPTPEIAQQILDNIPTSNKERAIDVEFCKLQKKGIIKHFLFPAISVLYLPEAQQGFSNPQMNIKDDFKNY